MSSFLRNFRLLSFFAATHCSGVGARLGRRNVIAHVFAGSAPVAPVRLIEIVHTTHDAAQERGARAAPTGHIRPGKNAKVSEKQRAANIADTLLQNRSANVVAADGDAHATVIEKSPVAGAAVDAAASTDVPAVLELSDITLVDEERVAEPDITLVHEGRVAESAPVLPELGGVAGPEAPTALVAARAAPMTLRGRHGGSAEGRHLMQTLWLFWALILHFLHQLQRIGRPQTGGRVGRAGDVRLLSGVAAGAGF